MNSDTVHLKNIESKPLMWECNFAYKLNQTTLMQVIISAFYLLYNLRQVT